MIPKYQRVKKALLERISRHEFAPGDLLPSERELM
ncbi:MAG: GntR family transcriptional regulator, partial [Acidobacteria bacterium]|nr:GntR family transcriptional regulator [Acidobacteriota bacterium]